MARFLMVLVLANFLCTLWGCAHVPVTGRTQLSLVPDSQLLAMSEKEYREFLKKHRLCSDRAQVEMVKRVGRRISQAVERFLAETGQSQRIAGYKWEFNLVCGKEINAFCMPGGKVVVYSGLLPVAKDENGLAVVLGHEIAHAVANHAAERLSQQLLLQLGGNALSMLTGSANPATRNLLMQLYGLGANVGVLLPYSRTQEYEADHLGLIFMAMAGYDPRGAITFWERMMKAGKGHPKPPEFLSTHPSDSARIQKIREYLPEALKYYRRYLQEHGKL
ncbi:MAG: M48 family metallopeptidase [Thermodesulfobacteria bacterium]|nr:M48 family metallopeptidase [Thermodesulfobacteriota bacterium]